MKALYRVDMFHCLVSLCLSLPTLYLHSPATDNVEASESKAGTSPTTASSGGAGAGKKDMKILATPSGRMNESNVLKFILGHHMVQIMLALPVNPVADEEEEEDGEGVIGDRGKGKRNMQKGKGKKEAVNNNGGKKKGNEEEENVKKGDVVAHDVMNVDEVATENMETAVSGLFVFVCLSVCLFVFACVCLFICVGIFFCSVLESLCGVVCLVLMRSLFKGLVGVAHIPIKY